MSDAAGGASLCAMRIILVALVLSACALPGIPGRGAAPQGAAVTVNEAPEAGVLRPRPRPGAGQVTAPAAVPVAAGLLGETLAGLGAPTEAGLWLRTGLVSAPRAGRVIAASGRQVAVELRPSGTDAGAGSQISLAAMQALGLQLGQLAPLRVFAD